MTNTLSRKQAQKTEGKPFKREIRKIDIDSEKQIYAYDVEVYPNLFCVTFVNLNDNSDRVTYYVCEDRDDRWAIFHFVGQEGLVLTGFNSLEYDNLMIAFLMESRGKKLSRLDFCQQIFEHSTWVVSIGRNDRGNEEFKKWKYYELPFRSIDLMKVWFFDMKGVSLKQCSINLKHKKVQDLPLKWNEPVAKEYIEQIGQYNFNDVEITRKLYDKTKEMVRLRQSITEIYQVDCINKSDSTMANAILDAIYSERTGKSRKEFVNLRTFRDKVKIGDCISPKIKFTSPIMQDFLSRYQELYWFANEEDKKEHPLSIGHKDNKLHIEYGGNTFKIGIGGIHSEDLPGIFEATEETAIIDADVTSFYPFMILNEKIKPEHLGEEFFDIYKSILDERVVAKKKYKETKLKEWDVRQYALKITANAIFGKMNSVHYWLYDMKAMMSVTVNGQLFLLMLIELFTENGIQVISANTDGVVCLVDVEQREVYDRCCEEWQKLTSLSLEYTHYQHYIRRDVNNYISIKVEENGVYEVKEKGVFESGLVGRNVLSKLENIYNEVFDPSVDSNPDEAAWNENFEPNLAKGAKRPPIVSIALRWFFLYGIRPEETITRWTDIYDFLISEKSSSKFQMYLTTFVGGAKITDTLQKNNRFYASRKGGIIWKQEKYDPTGVVRKILADRLVTLANDIDDSKDIREYGIDYLYYVEEVYKIIEKILPSLRFQEQLESQPEQLML